LDGHEAGAVKIAGKLSVLDECAVNDHLLEFVLGNKVVVFSIDLSRAR